MKILTSAISIVFTLAFLFFLPGNAPADTFLTPNLNPVQIQSVPFPSSNGMLDATFGAGGIVRTAAGTGNDVAQAVAIQPDGKIVAAGFGFNGSNNDFTVIRYNPNGTLDDTFDGVSNGNGIILTPVGANDDEAFGITIQNDGKIVVVGQSSNGINTDIAVVRYNTDGTLDATFDGDGRMTINAGTANDLGRSVAVQVDGKVVVTGNAGNGANFDIVLVRLEANGSLDLSFDGNSGNGNGVVTVAVGSANDQGYAVAIQTDGQIVVAGYYAATVSTDTVILRFNTDGRLDTTFDGDGIAPHAFSADDTDEALAMTLQSDGRIVIAGCIRGSGRLNDYLIARVEQNGSRDISFGTNGFTIVDFGPLPDIALGVAVQTDGKIISAGFANNGSNVDFGVTRVNANGTLDTSFDGDGLARTMIGTSADSANAIAIQADGKIVAVGRAVIGSTADFGMVRYGYGANAQGNDGFFELDATTAIRFDNAYQGGMSSVTLRNADSVPPLPAGWSFSGSPRDIQTSALFSGNINVRLTLPSNIALADFNAARVLQYDNGAWTDKTAASPPRDFATRAVYASVSSLGLIAAALPTASATATVSGRVTTPGGQSLRNVVVSIIDSNNVRRTATTSSFGLFSFADVAMGRTYTLVAASKRYRFTPQMVTVAGNITNLDFVGLE